MRSYMMYSKVLENALELNLSGLTALAEQDPAPVNWENEYAVITGATPDSGTLTASHSESGWLSLRHFAIENIERSDFSRIVEILKNSRGLFTLFMVWSDSTYGLLRILNGELEYRTEAMIDMLNRG